MTDRDCAQETAHRKYNRIGNVGMPRSERAFVVFLLPIWAGKVRAETKKIWDYREGEAENGCNCEYERNRRQESIP